MLTIMYTRDSPLIENFKIFDNVNALSWKIDNLQSTVNTLQTTIDKLKTPVIVTVTAYNADPNQTDSSPTITAFNTKVKAGGIAVSRDLFRNGWTAGKKVYIEGLGVFLINDLMHPRKKSQIDIFLYKKKDAINFGVKKGRHAVLLTEKIL